MYVRMVSASALLQIMATASRLLDQEKEAMEVCQPEAELTPDFPTRVMLIERSLLLLLVVGLLISALAILRPFATPILFGSAIAIATWPLRQFLVHNGIRRGLTAFLLFCLTIAIVLVPMMMIAPHMVEQLGQLTQRFQSFFASTPEKPVWIGGVPLIGQRLSTGWDRIIAAEGNVRILIEPYTTDIGQWFIGAAGALADSMVQLVLSLIAAALFWADGEGLIRMMHQALNRLGGPVAEQALDVAAGAVRGVAYGVIGTAAIQMLVLAVGLAIAGVPGVAVLSFIALLLAISQVGAPLLAAIWGGAAFWLFRQDHGAWGTFMIVWGLFVSTVDNLIRPWLIGFGIDMPLSLTVIGVFGGFIVFGFLGLFLGPTLLAIVYKLFMAWRTAVERRPAPDSGIQPMRIDLAGQR